MHIDLATLKNLWDHMPQGVKDKIPYAVLSGIYKGKGKAWEYLKRAFGKLKKSNEPDEISQLIQKFISDTNPDLNSYEEELESISDNGDERKRKRKKRGQEIIKTARLYKRGISGGSRSLVGKKKSRKKKASKKKASKKKLSRKAKRTSAKKARKFSRRKR